MAMLLLNNESVVPGDAGHGQDLYLLSNSIILILSKNIRLKINAAGSGGLYWTNSSIIIRWQVATERQILSHQVKVHYSMQCND